MNEILDMKNKFCRFVTGSITYDSLFSMTLSLSLGSQTIGPHLTGILELGTLFGFQEKKCEFLKIFGKLVLDAQEELDNKICI